MHERTEFNQRPANNNNDTNKHSTFKLQRPPIHDKAGTQKEKPPHDKISNLISIMALIISMAAAGFSGWQAIITNNSVKKQLRAYIVIKDITIAKPQTGSIYFGNIGYENEGVTPAYNCRHWIRPYFDTLEITREKIERLNIEPVKGFNLGANTPKHHFTHFCGLYDPKTGETNIRPEYCDAN